MQRVVDDLIPFVWPRPSAGDLAWVDDTFADSTPILMGGRDVRSRERRERRWLISTANWPRERYEPLRENPELFRTFIDLDESEHSYLSFANTYGLLGVDCAIEDDAKRVEFSVGEAYWRWRQEQAVLRAADKLASALGRKDGRHLAKCVAQRDGNQYVLSAGTISAEYGATRVVVRPPERWGKGRFWSIHDTISSPVDQLRFAARHWLARQANDRLGGEVSLAVSMRVVPSGPDDTELLPIRFVPGSLLSAMWWQFIEAVNGDRTFRKCAHCQKWFLVSPEGIGLRRHAKYCTPQCRLRHWRKTGRARGKATPLLRGRRAGRTGGA